MTTTGVAAGVALLAAACLTGYAFWHILLSGDENLKPGSLEKAEMVWWGGWITAAATGLGAAPFAFARDMSDGWAAICNAIAAGMMFAASSGLALEGGQAPVDNPLASLGAPAWLGSSWAGVTVGMVVGWLFVLATKRLLDGQPDLQVGILDGMDAKRALLILAVMIVHSMSEGIGLGVSFGGSNQLGWFICVTLAVHNIPEGLAGPQIALVMCPKGVSVLETAVWAIITSLPQPVMAVPALLLVEYFQALLPLGLGFAAGAMMFVAVFELLAEAAEGLGQRQAVAVACISTIGMASIQYAIHE